MRGKHSRNRKNRPLVIVLSLAMIFSAMTAFWSFGEGGDSSGSSTPTVMSSSGTGTETQTGSTDSTGSENNGSASGGTNESSVTDSTVPSTDKTGTQAQSDASSEDKQAASTDSHSNSDKASSDTAEKTYNVAYDGKTGIHSITEAEMILYCMSNLSVWPHIESGVGTVSPYIKKTTFDESDFNSTGDYENFKQNKTTFWKQVTAILYVGYPSNALGLYTIIPDNEASNYSLTEKEFDSYLDAPASIRNDFDSIGNTNFTYKNLTSGDQEDALKKKLTTFMEAVYKLGEDGKTTSGLTKSEIMATPFYKAASVIINTSDPLGAYVAWYPSQFVTEAQAYTQTNNAIWMLMKQYGFKNNNLSSSDTATLGGWIYANRNNDDVLQAEPTSNAIAIDDSGQDASFTYNPTKGKWYSDKLKVTEPGNYHGDYTLSTTKSSVKILDEDGREITAVKAGTYFVLESDSKPTGDVIVLAKSNVIPWVEATAVYSPTDTSDQHPANHDPAPFQNMLGVKISNSTVSINKPIGTKAGGLSITKKVKGESDSSKTYKINITLKNADVEGNYGTKDDPIKFTYDPNAKNSTASIKLNAGETKTIENLPSGIAYTVSEDTDSRTGYTVMTANAEGTVTDYTENNNKPVEVVVQNTKTNTDKPASDTGTLTLHKIFDGAGAVSLTDSEKENLSFDIKDSSGKTFITVPYKDFVDGSCKIEGIPVGTYTVQEKGTSDKVTTKYIVGSKETQEITISKDESSAMTITNTYPDNTPAVPDVPSVTVTPATADIRVQKLIIGNDGNWPEGASFTMNLQAVDNAPMPDGTANGVKSITVSNESPASFGTIKYEKAGTYHYIVTESKGSDKNFAYDETQHPVTVTVTESADHKLTASITGGNSSGIVEISNHYTTPKEENGGSKENSGGNKTNGSTNNSSGKNASGGNKVNGSTSNKTSGSLQPANTKTLKNSLAKNGAAASSGNASGSLVRTGDQTELTAMIALLLTSACGLAAVLALKKKRRDDRASEDRQ